MAGPLNPSNLNNPPPDTNITTTDVDTVTRASAALKELEFIQERVGKSAAKATEEMSEQNDTLEKAKGFLKSLIPEGLSLAGVFDKISESGIDVSPIKNMAQSVVGDLGSVIESAAGFSGVIISMGGGLVKDFFNPIKQGNVGVLESLIPDDSKFSGKISALRDSMQEFLDIQNVSRVGFMRWNTEVANSDDAISQANQAAHEYPSTIMRMATAYSVNGEELNKMMGALQGMPIILNQSEKASGDIIKTQNDMVAQLGQLIQVSKTFGMTEIEATARAKTGYTDFNQSVEETVSSLATMSAASKATGIDRKIADEQIMAASKSLAIFGQHSDAAANLWTTFTGSLKDTIPIRQIGEIVTDVTNKIAGMSVQNRAFISMMSGMSQGRSAMGGALQLEFAMRSPEGMEKNLQAMTSTLSQFAGGKIITLEEAANNPQLEIQFQLQRDLLGKISGISDPQAQNRVLEVLQKVQSGGISQVEGGKELSSLMNEGKNIQERQLNALDQIVNQLRTISGEVLKPEKQLGQVGDAILGRDMGSPDISRGVSSVRESIKRTSKHNSLLGNDDFIKDLANQFSGLAEGLKNVEKVNLKEGAQAAAKFIKEIGKPKPSTYGEQGNQEEEPLAPDNVSKETLPYQSTKKEVERVTNELTPPISPKIIEVTSPTSQSPLVDEMPVAIQAPVEKEPRSIAPMPRLPGGDFVGPPNPIERNNEVKEQDVLNVTGNIPSSKRKEEEVAVLSSNDRKSSSDGTSQTPVIINAEFNFNGERNDVAELVQKTFTKHMAAFEADLNRNWVGGDNAGYKTV